MYSFEFAAFFALALVQHFTHQHCLLISGLRMCSDTKDVNFKNLV